MQLFIEKGKLSVKTTWETLVKRTIHQYHTEEWRERTAGDSDFRIFRVFHSSITPSRSGNLAIHLMIYHSLSSLPSCGPFQHKPVFYVNYVY